MQKKKFHLSIVGLLSLGYFITIIIGTLLLLLPISIGSSILEISKSLISGTTNLTFISPEYLISFVVCIVVTLFSLFTMFKIIKKEKTYLFSYYLIPLGILMMIKGLYINTFIIL